MPSPLVYVVGSVQHAQTSAGLRGLQVQVMKRQGRSIVPVGTAITDAQGQFQAKFTPGGTRATSYEVRVFQEGRRLDVEEGSDRFEADTPPASIILKAVPFREPTAIIPGSPTVSGTIMHVDGTPISGATVTAFHLAVGTEVALGTPVPAGQDGSYTISYGLPQGVQPGEVMLVVRAVDDVNAVLGASHVVPLAEDAETVDVFVDADAIVLAGYVPYTEYGDVDGVVSGLLGAVTPDAVSAQDVEILHLQTGIQRDWLTAYIVARRLNVRLPAVSSESFYALQRAGRPSNLARLSAVEADHLVSDLEQSAEDRVISEAEGALAANTAAAIAGFRVATAKDGNIDGSLKQIVATTTVSGVQQDAFVDAYLGRTLGFAAFWADLRSGAVFSATELDQIERALRLSILFFGHVPMISAFNGTEPGILSPDPSVAAEKSQSDWEGLVDGIVGGGDPGTPPCVNGADATEQKINYASLLLERAERIFPSRAVRAGLLADLPPGDTLTFLTANPLFDFDTADIGDLAVSDDAKTDLRAWQRLFRIGPDLGRYGLMKALSDAGLDSAHDVVRRGFGALIEAFTPPTGPFSESLIAAVWQKAGHAVARADGLLASHHRAFNRLGLRVIEPRPDPETVTGIPEYAELFGDQSACSCEHCTSVFSPAAYFADLLQWLDSRGHLADLTAKRPDLPLIALSCRNTQTLMPYSDLVLEVLERAAAGALPADLIETSGTSDERRARPATTIAAAYEPTLLDARFPLALPLDRNHLAAEAYLPRLSVTRWQLADAFAAHTATTGPERAALEMGLSARQLDVATSVDGLSTSSPDERCVLWGYDASEVGSYIADLSILDVFMGRAELSFDEALDLVHCRLSGGIEATLADGSDPCKVSNYSLESGGGAPSASELEALRRLVRVTRDMGLETRVADVVFSALAASSPLDGTAVERLSTVKRLSVALNLDLERLAAFWTGIDTYADRADKAVPLRSLASRLFEDPTLDPNGDFALVASGGSGPLDQFAHEAGTPVLAKDALSVLQAALGAPAEALSTAIKHVAASASSTYDTLALTLVHASAIARRIWLANGLNVGVSTLLDWVDGSAIDPFTAGAAGPSATLSFVEEVAGLSRAAGSLSQALWLLAPGSFTAIAAAPDDADLADILVPLRADVRLWRTQLLGDSNEPLRSVRAILERLPGPLTESVVEDLVGLVADSRPPTGALLTERQTLLSTALGSMLEDPADAEDKLITGPGFLIAVSQEPSSGPGRAEYLIDALVPYLLRQDIIGLAGGALSDGVGLSEQATADVLGLAFQAQSVAAFVAQAFWVVDPEESMNPASGLTRTNVSTAFLLVERLLRIADLVSTLELGDDEVRWWLGDGATVWADSDAAAFGLLDPSTVPATGETTVAGSGVVAMTTLFTLRRLVAPAEVNGLIALTRALRAVADDGGLTSGSFAPGGDLYEQRRVLSEVGGWSASDVEHVFSSAFGFATDEDVFSLAVFEGLVRQLELARRTSVSTAELHAWAGRSITSAQADAIIQHVRGRSRDAATWATTAKPLRDQLRRAQQQALVAHLIHADSTLASSADLYAKYLIDVEMSPCAMTSRLKEAASAVQLFIHRAFLGLEAPVLDDEDRAQWTWMKNYRVWEAARKVFCYPENWLEPDLRADRTPLWDAFEQELQQGALTTDRVSGAFTRYLEGLHQLSTLHVIGLSHSPASEGRGRRSHMIARTRSLPHSYFYRLKEGDRWYPWHPVDLNLESDHVLPVEFQERLFLFWVSFEQSAVQQGTGTDAEAVTRWRVALSWSEYRDGEWLTERRAADVAEEPPSSGANGQDRSRYLVRVLLDGDTLAIRCLQPPLETSDGVPRAYRLGGAAFDELIEFGRWSYDSCLDEFVLEPADDLPRVPHARPASMTPSDNHYGARAVGLVPALVGAGNPDVADESTTRAVPIIDARQDAARVVSDITEVVPAGAEPFVVQLGSRTYWIHPTVQDDLDGYEIQTRPRGAPIAPAADPRWGPCGTAVTDPVFGAWFARRRDVSLRNSRLLNGMGRKILRANTTLSRQSEADEDSSTSDAAAFTFTIEPLHVPFTCSFLSVVRRDGALGLLAPQEVGTSPAYSRQQITEPVFDDAAETHVYRLHPSADGRIPVDEVRFDADDPSSDYHWEFFVHGPMYVGLRLAAERRFDESLSWFHALFDPLNRNGSTYPGTKRFWRAKPLLEGNTDDIDFWASLSSGTPSVDLIRQQASLESQLDVWRQDPFQPHQLATLRYGAYQRAILMRYLDTVIAWADDLFGQDSIESINEATQLYLLAHELLGDRPEVIEPPGGKTVHAYSTVTVDGTPRTGLNSLLWDKQERAENAARFTRRKVMGTRTEDLRGEKMPALGLGYFCVPLNGKLLSYWDTVADRLFKIRNCMDIDGRVRQLPLFQPPIDPGLLVRAAAAGVRLADVLSGLNAPRGPYRFTTLVGQARALTGNVRALGQALLSAIEKRDSERLAQIRATHEVALLEANRSIRAQRVQEAKEGLEATRTSRRQVEQRKEYYEALIAAGLLSDEQREQDKTKSARRWELGSSITSALAGALAVIPDVEATLPPGVKIGGYLLERVLRAGAAGLSAKASWDRTQASLAGMDARNQRREQEWGQQVAQAALELEQLDQQIVAAEIRVALAEREVEVHQLQVEQSRTVRTFMERKFSNEALYRWMEGQLSALYFQSYQLALDMARRAERAFQYELGEANSSFVGSGHFDSRQKGLLAGERLTLELDQMETAFFERHRREYELTRPISLHELDPIALELLKTKGVCFFQLPEVLFDLDYPGHFMRRMKAVSITVSATVGAMSTMTGTLTLMESATRTKPVGGSSIWASGGSNQQERGLGEAIATSSGLDDAGVFSMDFGDPRYLPFEGRGVVSVWKLELSGAEETLPGEGSPPSIAALKRFDWDSITDVTMTVRYMARDGGFAFRKEVRDDLVSALNKMVGSTGYSGLSSDGSGIVALELSPPGTPTTDPSVGQRLGISLRRDQPDAWHGFIAALSDVGGGAFEHETAFPLTLDDVPIPHAGQTITLQQVEAELVLADGVSYSTGTALAEALNVEVTYNGVNSTLVFKTPDDAATRLEGFAQASDAQVLSAAVEADKSLGLETVSVGSVNSGLLVSGESRLDPSVVKDIVLILHYSLS